MTKFHPDTIRKRLLNGLPGESAQRIMAPSVRFTHDKLPDPQLSVESSILIILYPLKGSWGTLLMERTKIGPHGGQISFPGGKKDPEDNSNEETALREAYEEVGLDTDSIDILGCLSKLYVPNSNFWINPFIGFTERAQKWIPNPTEVKDLIPVKLETLFDDGIKKRKIISRNGVEIDTPYYDVKDHFVWGATAMIISEFETLVK
jgi:8-oxo-dGTP pyrophosphatase MutT (NUDIX family)